MDMKQLRIFSLLAARLSFSDTGGIFNLSQSAVSKQISLLEAELGEKLFERSTRKVALSEFGQLLLPYAQQIITLEEEMRSAAENYRQQLPCEMFYLYTDTTLLNGAPSVGLPQRILHAMLRFRQQFSYNISNHIFPEYDWLATVRFRMFDVALLRQPISETLGENYGSLGMRIIRVVPQYLVVHDAGRTYRSREEAIASVRSLLQDNSISRNQTLTSFLAKTGAAARITDCDHWNNLFIRLMSSQAATVVQENALVYFNGMDVQIFPLDGLKLEDCICAYWRKSNPKAGVPELIDALQAEFSAPLCPRSPDAEQATQA